MTTKMTILGAMLLAACGGKGGNEDAGSDAPADFPGDALTDGSAGTGLLTCPSGFAEDTGSVFWVDPATGSDDSDGSASSPWASIQHVIDEMVDCADQHGDPHHPDGAPVQGGDTIVLVGADGHDQDIDVSGCYNDETVTIRADVLHEPRVRSIHFRGSAGWRIDGLTFFHDGAGTMVRIEDHDWQGEVYDVEIWNCFLTSGDLRTVSDFEDHASTGIHLLHDAEHVTVACNHLYKVGQAMTVSGENIEILSNTIEFFSRDGFAHGGHHNRFIGNLVYDAIKLGDGHHDDFYQNHMGANPDVSSDIEIAYNVFMNRYPTDEFPVEMLGATQCLSAFEDGPKTDIRIYNNVCKTDHWHGITWDDTNDSVIVNNTAVGGTDLPGLPEPHDEWPTHSWISVEGTGNVVRNNITTHHGGDGDHNHVITADDVDAYFTDFASLDLSLAPGSPAIDDGNPDMAPDDDVTGAPRDARPDVGAYEYVP